VIAGGHRGRTAGRKPDHPAACRRQLFCHFLEQRGNYTEQIIERQYQVSLRVTVSATRDPNGGFALDALLSQTTFREADRPPAAGLPAAMTIENLRFLRRTQPIAGGSRLNV
jgi:hypothetical protein